MSFFSTSHEKLIRKFIKHTEKSLIDQYDIKALTKILKSK